MITKGKKYVVHITLCFQKRQERSGWGRLWKGERRRGRRRLGSGVGGRKGEHGEVTTKPREGGKRTKTCYNPLKPHGPQATVCSAASHLILMTALTEVDLTHKYSERLSNSPKVTQLINCRTTIQTQVHWFQTRACNNRTKLKKEKQERTKSTGQNISTKTEWVLLCKTLWVSKAKCNYQT